MADNVTANSGSGGATFASDDIGGVQFPRTKLIHGADGTNDGDVSTANPLPVDLRTDNLSGNLDVNIAAQAADVTIADGGNSLTVDNGGTFAVQVDAALPTGSNAIGKLAANSGVDIGDVDVTSVPNASSHYRNVDANAEAAIKGSAGTLYWVHVMNMTAAVAYLHLYDATTATVNPGTTTPTFTFPIPTQGDTNGAGFMIPFPNGHAFATAITLVVTTTIDGSAGDPGTNGVFVNAGYT